MTERLINMVLAVTKTSLDKSQAGKHEVGTLILSGAVRKDLTEKEAF